jgi:uncharacterized membrane protein
VFFVIALSTLPAYLSGVAAQSALQDHPGVSQASIGLHQDAALLAFVFMEVTGFVAWLGLWHIRRGSRPTQWSSAAVLVLSVVTVVSMTDAANLGGEIRHPEILSRQETPGEATAVPKAAWLKSGSIQTFVVGYDWVWPASETLHFVGLSLLFGILTLVNLRMLGLVKDVSFAAVHRLLPWAMLGLGINVVTGMLFFIGKPDQYTHNVVFYWKVGLLMLAGVNLLYMTMSGQAWALQPGDDPPPAVQAIALSSIFLWCAVMYCGRMLPFIGNAF